ncbi:hypothetical protein EVAR_10755_1 [Eumeta japonica]|uniref:Uncharacterized protein n=1 Tax=Eumeta variegata TaxID=151549 RepID=A0A4C1W9I1_EUMVA|nr:hypothetical protein EVAR_10755_1 [Eumeta japonica]
MPQQGQFFHTSAATLSKVWLLSATLLEDSGRRAAGSYPQVPRAAALGDIILALGHRGDVTIGSRGSPILPTGVDQPTGARNPFDSRARPSSRLRNWVQRSSSVHDDGTRAEHLSVGRAPRLIECVLFYSRHHQPALVGSKYSIGVRMACGYVCEPVVE